ncbi:aminodeoxychorismate lyase [Parapedobacter pyrenivorans]|uniref:Endolytic murein transglycosylase n=1 Tax=Parapedobacter pyrenivorans TaxID=1305674 RepID=A0A917MB24_9SPHI|nr:endolytic transglycosylase MltG [Parapedobacter pyrenivorans]GGG86377.1 aminodeoxychorismate lyase [Parapedobacter pyrenivorans]
MEKKKRRGLFATLLIVAAMVIAVGGVIAYKYYKAFFAPNVTAEAEYLYIYTHWDFEDIMTNLSELHAVDDTAAFRWAANKMDYPGRVKPGKYKLEPGMNNRTLINKLGGGFQEPVKLRFENVRLKENLATVLAKQLEPDSIAFINLLNNDSLATRYGFNTENFLSMFIPNTYEFYWNTSIERFADRMNEEYQKFWNDDRREKAAALNLSPQEVGVLASIVKGEALHTDEMPSIAGLYLNRLRKGMLLQADPTVIFANNDFTIRRVLYRHLRTDSPYNTYLYRGLPPGPIMMPSIASIDATLNYQQHDYLYMCAKDDFSGYHNFAVTQAEHNINARKFQQALNERNIKR